MAKSLRPILEIVKKLELPEKYFEQIGPYGGKVRLDLLNDGAYPRRGKLILVTATTPTASGEGKTVTSIGLTQGLARIGKKVIITSREPSLGPVFGMKGGAAGGGASTIEPAAKINLHFHGDFHAIAAAHNLLAALVDAHLFHGNDLNLDPERITWPRTMDMNDRALRAICDHRGVRNHGHHRAGQGSRGPARQAGQDRCGDYADREACPCRRPAGHRRDDGAADRSDSAEPGADG